MLLTLKYFVSLRNLFLGADWIWTFKFLCLTRQQSIPWLCFTSPGTDPLPVPHAQHSKTPLAASLPSTLCHGTLHSTAWEFLSYCLKCHPSMLAGETCALLFFSCKEIPLKSDLPCVATHLPDTCVSMRFMGLASTRLAASVCNDPWNQARCFQEVMLPSCVSL